MKKVDYNKIRKTFSLYWPKKYYGNNKERLGQQARNKYKKVSNKEINIKQEHGRNRYQNMSEENKQRLIKEYEKTREDKKST